MTSAQGSLYNDEGTGYDDVGMRLYTSSFAKAGKHKNAVAISLGKPKGWSGREYPALAPTRAMLKMRKEDYVPAYLQILEGLDPAVVAGELGDEAIMLCWEGLNDFCHRRMVAEWIEEALGIEVPEWGLERTASTPWAEQEYAEKKPHWRDKYKRSAPPKEFTGPDEPIVPDEPELFDGMKF